MHRSVVVFVCIAVMIAMTPEADGKSPPGFAGVLKGWAQAGNDPVRAVKRWELSWRVRYMFGQQTTELAFRWWQKPNRQLRVLGRRVKRSNLAALNAHVAGARVLKPSYAVITARIRFKDAGGRLLATGVVRLRPHGVNVGDGSWSHTKHWWTGLDFVKLTKTRRLHVPGARDAYYGNRLRQQLFATASRIELRGARLTHLHFPDATWQTLSGLPKAREWKTRAHRKYHRMRPRTIAATEASIRANPFTIDKMHPLRLDKRQVWISLNLHRLLYSLRPKVTFEFNGVRYTRPRGVAATSFPVPRGSHSARVIIDTMGHGTITKTITVTGHGSSCRRGETRHTARNGRTFCCPPGTKGYYRGRNRIDCRRTYTTAGRGGGSTYNRGGGTTYNRGGQRRQPNTSANRRPGRRKPSTARYVFCTATGVVGRGRQAKRTAIISNVFWASDATAGVSRVTGPYAQFYAAYKRNYARDYYKFRSPTGCEFETNRDDAIYERQRFMKRHRGYRFRHVHIYYKPRFN